MRKYESVGIGIPEILLPKEEYELSKWAVIACDQFTSQPEYWEQVEKLIGSAPSTLNLIYPEVYLGEDKPQRRIDSIRNTMTEYLNQGVLVPQQGIIFVEREANNKLLLVTTR